MAASAANLNLSGNSQRPIGGVVMNTAAASPVISGSCSAGHFVLWIEQGSEFDLNPTAFNVACEVYTNLSGLISSPISSTGNKVNILCTNVSTAITTNTNAAALASSYYVPPTNPSNPNPGIVEGMIYKALVTGQDPYQTLPIISLNRIAIELEEVVIMKPKLYKYLKLKGYFRSLQINEDRPHYFIDGIVEMYISLNSDKIKIRIISNRSFENKSINQLSPTYFFMVAGVPIFNEFTSFKNLNNEYNLKTVNNLKTIILDKETNLEKGTISILDNNSNLQLEIISTLKPKIIKAFGMETDYTNYTINSIYENNENQSIFGSKKMESSLRNKSRITNQIELSALGRHAFCKGKSRAGDATVLDFPVENLRPCSQFIWLLYGLKN